MTRTDINNLAEEYIRKKSYEDLTWTEEMHIEDGFKAGFAASNKIVLDTLNKHRSDLSQLRKVKLDKTLNLEKIELQKARVEVLENLYNKLK